jgi:broad specificity phosphatase PhoE
VPKLVLIKHSLPEVRPGEAPPTWPLSDEGRRRCATLAERLRPLDPRRILASREPKATETARLLGAALGLPVEVGEGLHEHVRDHEPYRSQDDFNAVVQRFFEHPSERVFGDETAAEALRRFVDAIKPLVSEASENVAVVAHGTVISLYLAEKCGIDGFDLWRRLETPSYVVLETPSLRLVEVVGSMRESSTDG